MARDQGALPHRLLRVWVTVGRCMGQRGSGKTLLHTIFCTRARLLSCADWTRIHTPTRHITYWRYNLEFISISRVYMHCSQAAQIAQRHHATLASCRVHVAASTRRSVYTAPLLGSLSGCRESPCGSAKPLRMSAPSSRCMMVMVRKLLEATAACKGREGRARSPGEVGSFGARACSTLTCCLWRIWSPDR